MSALRIDEPAVLLVGPHVAAAWSVVRLVARSYESDGKAVPRVLQELLVELAPCPERDRREELQGHAEPMTTTQAAELLGVSPRTVRRLADGLGGQLIAGRLVLDAVAVRQHHEGTQL